MKVALTVDSVIVDSETGLKVLEILSEAQYIKKHWQTEQYEFVELTDSQLRISPVNMKNYAEATLNLDNKK
jgi:hypothetical protein